MYLSSTIGKFLLRCFKNYPYSIQMSSCTKRDQEEP